MSENLGPIHYLMYEKIKFQDTMTSYIMDGDTKIIDEKIKPVSKEALDQIIDQDNIHGFLSSKIDIVENRLNMALNLSKNTEEKLFNLGKECSKGKDLSSVEEIFSDLNNYLLDGMPCDNALSAMMGEDGDLFLITNQNMHSQYQNFVDPETSLDDTCAGGHDHDHHDSFDIKENAKIDLKNEVSPYHLYRYEFLKGYLANSNYDIEIINGINYRIFKK